MAEIYENFTEKLKKEGFKEYTPESNDQVFINSTIDMAITRHLHTSMQLDIAAYIFSAISNTASDQVYFSYSEMKNFILHEDPTKNKSLTNETKKVLTVLQAFRIDAGDTVPLFNKIEFNKEFKLIMLTLNSVSIFAFGPVYARQRK